MELSVNFLMWLAAALPIVILLLLMTRFQWGAKEAALVGLVVSIIVGMAFYKADYRLIVMESAKGIWSAISVLIVVWPAILIFEVACEAKTFSVFRLGIQKLLPNELLQILAMGWGFVSFLQGITGFGVPIAVGAPLLAGIGVLPLWAVIIPLVGQAWGNTFGTLAVAWDALLTQSGLFDQSAALLAAMWASAFLWIFNFITGVVICWFYGRWAAVRKGLPAVLVISLIHGGGELLLARTNYILAAFFPSCLAIAAVLLLGRTALYRKPWACENSQIMDRSFDGGKQEEEPGGMTMHQAFMPYYVLTAITLGALFISPVERVLGGWSLSFSFPAMTTGYGYVIAASEHFAPLTPFTHAGFFILLSALLGVFYYRSRGWLTAESTKEVFRRSVAKTIPSAVSITGFIIMSRIMGGSGQTMMLAEGITSVLGKGYVICSPLIGMLGSFITGSNMSSNILFAKLQMTTATMLGFAPPAILGAQTVGGAIGSMVSPSKIVLGTITANIAGQEGLVLRKVFPLAAMMAILVGLILLSQLMIL